MGSIVIFHVFMSTVSVVLCIWILYKIHKPQPIVYKNEFSEGTYKTVVQTPHGEFYTEDKRKPVVNDDSTLFDREAELL